MVSWTGSILPANRHQRVAMLMCSHVSKNKQINNCHQHRLNPHGRGLMVTAANNAYCVIPKGNDDTYDGEIAGSHSWLNGSYLELSWGGGGGGGGGDTFDVIITRTGANLMFPWGLGSTICLTNFGSHDNCAVLDPVLYGGSGAIRSRVIRGLYYAKNLVLLVMSFACLMVNGSAAFSSW